MNCSEEEEAGKSPFKMSSSEGELEETTEPIREKETMATESLKLGSLEQQPGGADEHVGIKGALGPEDLSPPVEMPLPGGGSVQQSAARSQLREEQPGEPEEEHRSKRPRSPVPSDVMSMRSDLSKDPPLNFKRRRQKMATDVSAAQVLCDVCPSLAVKTCVTCMDSYCMSCIRPHYCDPDLEEHQLQDLQLHGHDVTGQDPQGTHYKSSSNREYVPPPGQIQFPSVKKTSVTVSWSPPEGAAGPHRYRVTWRQDPDQCSATVKQLMMEVTGLLPGQKYHFTVATLSEHGRQSTCVKGSVQTESSDSDKSTDGDRPNMSDSSSSPKLKRRRRTRRRRREEEKEERERRMTGVGEMEKYIFVRLDLEREITFTDALTISPHSVHQQACTEREMGNRFLQSLLTGNYSARYMTVREETTVSANAKQMGDQGSSGRGEGRTLANISQQGSSGFSAFLKKTNQTEVRKPAQIHPMDVQMAVFHHADHFLKLLIVTKLSQCQYALPLLVPNPFTKEIEFPLWTFHQIKKSWKMTNTKGEVTSKSRSVCKVETPMVAFFRLGPVSSSKSQLMNSLINEKHNTFFHRNSPGSSRTRLLMDGVVEIAWYCPSGKPTDKFTDCVAFCNLHSDAGDHPLQRRILTEMATINVVLLSELRETGGDMAIVQELFESPKPLICILTEDEDPITESGKDNYRIGLKSRNQSDVSAELISAIKLNLSEGALCFKLDNVSRSSEIKVDTESEGCRGGKKAAVQMMQLLETKDPLRVKETFLPCQGKLWHDWSQLSKDLHRLRGEKPELEKGKKLKLMKDIRLNQRAKGLTELMRLFTGYLKTLSATEKKYFLKWVGSLMDDMASDKLSDLLQEYDKKWKEVLDLKKTHDKLEMETKRNELETISNKLTIATFGLEHFLREMGQIYEAWKSTQKDFSRKADITVRDFPKMAAELMISGHPMELMDGDAAQVPLIWVTAVIDELIQIVGDQRVFVLSVLGVQSSGKSTMLNAMFGLQFAVSAGRCTKGAFMQLVKVSEEMKAELKFGYILVVDTEGLRALELAGKATVHHDNELATFVVGLGNMTLINIFGENPSEMQDILQIVVQAFLRMKKVRLNPSCIFVHQNVTDVTAGEKNMEGRRRLQEKLDEMTKLAAKEEVCDAECFNDVIAFDIENDVKYFAQLWEGSPPMAPPNPSYSENIQELRKTILSHASKSNGFTLKALKTCIEDLWNALLNEDFVFSFKNTLEIAAYRSLEEEYGKWTWTLRSEMLKIEDQLHTTINNGRLQGLKKGVLEKPIGETFQNVQKEMNQCFDNDRLKDILIQWRIKFELKIKELHDDLVEKAKTKLSNVISQRDARKKLDEKKEDHEKKLFEKSKELALKLKQKGVNERELKKAFDSMWKDWVSELKKNTTPISDIDIRQNMLHILYETLEYGLVQRCLNDAGHTSINQIGDYSHYVTLTRGLGGKIRDALLGVKCLTPKDNNSIRKLINDITKQADRLVKSKPVEVTGYNTSYIQEIVHLVMTSVKEYKPKQTQFDFKKEFKVDLSLYVCEHAVEKFVELHKTFRETNDPHIYLERKKPEYYNVFQIYCRGATSAAVLGDLICNELKESILKKAYNRTATDIAGEMRENIPAFRGNRYNMEKHILKLLAEEENFDKFMTYIQNPGAHFKSFIKEEVDKYISKCTKAGKPIILIMIKDHIEELQKCVVNASTRATQEIKTKKGNAKLWLQSFSDNLSDVLENRCTDLSGENVSDFDLLSDIIKRELPRITEELNSGLSSVDKLDMEMFRERPDEILIEHFCQCCWKQCPFCGAICTNTMEDHPGDHMVPFHRVNGIIGWHYSDSEKLILDFCTTLVSSDQTFESSPGNDLPKITTPCKKYRSAGGDYAEWSITPDNSELPYWKWFVWRFQTELEEHHKIKLQPGVADWKKYSKKDAIESVDKYI